MLEDPNIDNAPDDDDNLVGARLELGITSSTPKKHEAFSLFFPDLSHSLPSPIIMDSSTKPITASTSVKGLMFKHRATKRSLLNPNPKQEPPIVVEDCPSVKSPPKWIPELNLFCSDKQVLLDPNGWVTDSIIDAAQDLIKMVNPVIGGLQKICCGLAMSFKVESDEFIQIVTTGNSHWILLSTVGTEHPTVLVYDSLYCSVSRFVMKQNRYIVVYTRKEIRLQLVNMHTNAVWKL